MTTKTIKVNHLARVEGEGALYIRVKDDRIEDIKLNIFEPPRFFEGFLAGRKAEEAIDITARICGICAAAYQMSAVYAIERAFDIKVDPQVRALRRLMVCGEWIESHVLHVFMLHAPDFLGYEDAIRMAADYPDVVKRGLRMKKIGNEITTVIGGRAIHPISAKVGGFYHVPTRADLQTLVEDLEWAREAAAETARWAATLDFPVFEQDYEFVSLRHEDEYPFNEGRLISNKGLDIDISEYEQNFTEIHVKRSTALHSRINGRDSYLVGPLARYNLNYDKLSPMTQAVAREIGYDRVVTNPFQSIVVRLLETLYACDEALRIIEQYQPPAQPAVPYQVKPGVGYGCTEAPRGILFHRYTIDEQGFLIDSHIVPPTSQNQKMIESDLWQYLEQALESPRGDLTWQCEQIVRNYDPCISCSVHFLKVETEHV